MARVLDINHHTDADVQSASKQIGHISVPIGQPGGLRTCGPAASAREGDRAGTTLWREANSIAWGPKRRLLRAVCTR